MGGDWKVVPLSEIAEVIDSRHKTPVYAEDGLPMVRVVDVKNGNLDLQGAKKVSLEIYRDFSKGRDPEVGDIVVSRVGSYGNFAHVNSRQKFCLGQNTASIVPVINSRFLYYQLISPKARLQLDEQAVGAVQKTVSLKSIRGLKIEIPSEREQIAIAHILSTLDNKIELNRQTNETLEAMAQAMFKSWFVDFDPVIDNALAAGNDIPEPFQARAAARLALGDARKPLPEEIRCDFPDEFVFSDEMGWVPRGWEYTALMEIANILNGHAFKSADYVDDGVFVLRTRNFGNDGLVHRGSNDVYLSEEFLESHSQYICENFDFHIVMVGASIGKTSLLLPHILPAIRNQNMWCFRAKDNMPSRAYLRFAVELKVNEVIGWASGSARSFFRKSDFNSHKVLVPSDEVLRYFQENIEPLYGDISINTAENSNLESMRDTLLPKLLSGQLTIPNAEKLVAEAL